MEESEIKKYLGQVLYFLSFRSRSEKELASYLAEKELGNKDVAVVIERVRELGLIDDVDFCRQVIESKIKRAYGPKKIYFDLLNKGIEAHVAKEMLAAIEPETWGNAIKNFLHKKRISPAVLDDSKEKARLSASLYSRGYDGQTVKNAIDALRLKE